MPRVGDAELAVTPAAEPDLAVASEILTEAARWLIDRGDPLWKPADLTPDRLHAQAAAGLLHLGRVAGDTVGTIVLVFEDPLFWPDVGPDDSAFVHRLAVRRRVAGTGVARALMAWAEGRAREAGRSWLRLDCSAAHPGLSRYYERLGFSKHSVGSLGDSQFVRYQKRLEVDSPGWSRPTA